MKRTFITSAIVGSLLLAGAGAANADTRHFDEHARPQRPEARLLLPALPRIVIMPYRPWHERAVRYRMAPRYYFRHQRHDRYDRRHDEWRADAYPYRR